MRYLVISLLFISSLVSAQTPNATGRKLQKKLGNVRFGERTYRVVDSTAINVTLPGQITSLTTGLTSTSTTSVSALALAQSNTGKINQLLSATEGYLINAKVNSQTVIQPVFQFDASSLTYNTNAVCTFSCVINPASNLNQLVRVRAFFSNVASPISFLSGTSLQKSISTTFVAGVSSVFSTTFAAPVGSQPYVRVLPDFSATDVSQAAVVTVSNIQLSIAGSATTKIPSMAFYYPSTANTGDTFTQVVAGSSSSSSGSSTVSNPTSGTLTLDNAEKIVITSNSYYDGLTNLVGKATVNVVSGLSEYNWLNFSRAGRTPDVLATEIATLAKYFTTTFNYYQLKAKYALLSENQNAKSNGQSDSTYYANTQVLINTIRGAGVEPILATEPGGWNATVADGEQRNEKGLKALADINGLKFIDLTAKSSTFNTNYNARFWKSQHPGTRTNYLMSDGIRKQLKQLIPRPRQSLKLFRVRGTTTVSGINSLLFRTIPERYAIYKELYVGHRALGETNAGKMRYDTISGFLDDVQSIDDEYLKMRSGTPVSFGTYAMIDAVLPVYQPTGLSLIVSDTTSSLTVYARRITSTGSSWTQVTGTKGVYSIADNSGLTDYDRATFLLTKPAGVTLTNAYLSWASGITKQTQFPVPSAAPKGAELLTQTYVGNSTQLGSWSVTGGISAISSPDGVLPTSTVGLVEVSPTASISQTFTAPISDDPTEVVIRVWARRWVPFFSQLSSFSSAPITYETADTGTLRVNITGATGQSLSQFSDVVGLHWTEVEFRGILPASASTNTQKMQVFAGPGSPNLQIAKVSIKTLN